MNILILNAGGKTHEFDHHHGNRGGLWVPMGAAATIVTTWITQRTQTVRAEREAKLRDREALYGEFITEACA